MTLQTQAKAGPAIPGLEQGNPAATNRQAPAAPGTPGAPAQTGQPVITTGGGRNETATEIRDRIRTEIQNATRDGRDPRIDVNPDFRNVVPEGAVIISVALFMSIAATIILAPLARAFARRMDARNQHLASGAHIAPQIEQLQQSVDAMALELERITEAQRFQSKLLAGREKEPERIQR